MGGRLSASGGFFHIVLASGRGGARLVHSPLQLLFFVGTAVLLYVRASFTGCNVCSVGVCVPSSRG